ncbi:hypothetical protein A2115_01405 [Candidatus Woesebacteria bacterium GWA1_41_8]|uniref:DUF1648 domain-containing protein n=1 Tax=Candidatus Woesebacteria bacterium GWA1_41_8 TaxID=1802471 RepID=A0A1F7WMC5_9BACT|nr:MAG: hypothetical protein A2115_01405 [Candidatus Woesebacteria bacterium GWA1_41_8]
MAKDFFKLSLVNQKIAAQNSFNRKVFIFSAAFNIVIALASLLVLRSLPPQVPLFYGLPETEERLAASWMLAVPSAVSFLILLGNASLSLFTEDEFSKKILAASTLAASLFSAITTLKIISLVGSF